MENSDFWEKILPPTLSLIVTGIISVIIGVYLERFKRRLTFLKKKITSQGIAFTTKDDFWGNIKIIYNKDYEAQNIYFITVEIINDTSNDLDDLTLEIRSDPDCWILTSDAFYTENKRTILFTKSFDDFYKDVVERNQRISESPDPQETQRLKHDINFIFTNKHFFIPILNRNSSITVNLMVDNRQDAPPSIIPSIQKKGIKIIDYVDKRIDSKRNQNISAVIGLFLVTFFLIIISNLFPENTLLLIFTGIFCAFSSLFGWIMLLLYRYAKRFFT